MESGLSERRATTKKPRSADPVSEGLHRSDPSCAEPEGRDDILPIIANRDRDVLARFYHEISRWAEKELRPEPKSVRFMLDFARRRYPKAKSISQSEYTELNLLNEIRRSGFVQSSGLCSDSI